ncbi:TadE family protein [Microbacterium pumilum]|uniref:TadE family protein n=1 Tax=Microbacterium pumilum TaxID=344165 RepID=A0ABN2SSX1_9MICO
MDDPERGSAALEFIVVGLILLVPLVYLVLALGLIQGQALGVEAGARHIARAVSLATDADSARVTAARVLDSLVDEYGFDADSVHLDLSCAPAGAFCPQAGATLIVKVRTTVTLPLVPPVLGLDRLASIPIEASSAQKVSRFWGTG